MESEADRVVPGAISPPDVAAPKERLVPLKNVPSLVESAIRTPRMRVGPNIS
jgi:hypothetical protein